MGTSTQISNATTHVMKVQVGSARHASELATVPAGRKHSIEVNVNATYREYIIETDAPGLAKIVVSSDDLCDYKCITIKEENGSLVAEREPRQSNTATPSQTPKKTKWVPAWMSRSER